MFKAILRSLNVLWFRGSSVQCNCCSLKFRSFVFKPDIGGQASFLCPSCRSTADDRLLNYFLQTDTSFYSKDSRNLLFVKHNRFGAHAAIQGVSMKNADFLVCNDLSLCSRETIDEFLSGARAGARFVFACQYPSPSVMKKQLIDLLPDLKLTELDYNGSIEIKDRAFWGLTSNIPIYIISKSWTFGR